MNISLRLADSFRGQIGHYVEMTVPFQGGQQTRLSATEERRFN